MSTRVRGRVPGSGMWYLECECGGCKLLKKWDAMRAKSCGCLRKRVHNATMKAIFRKGKHAE